MGFFIGSEKWYVTSGIARLDTDLISEWLSLSNKVTLGFLRNNSASYQPCLTDGA